MSKPKQFDAGSAAQYIRGALALLTADELGNLAYHLSEGHALHAGPIAYKWAGAGSGCLLTLATSRETMSDALDFETQRRIEKTAVNRYRELSSQIGIEFYISTAIMKSSELRQLVIDFLKESGNNSLSSPEVTHEP